MQECCIKFEADKLLALILALQTEQASTLSSVCLSKVYLSFSKPTSPRMDDCSSILAIQNVEAG